MKTLIIAEAGVNHNGDIEIARRLIDAAAEAGADIVKFQTFSADRLVGADAPLAEYQARNLAGATSQHAMLKRLELSTDDHRALIAHADGRGIDFLSTGFDIESVDLLQVLGARWIKVPSGEITNLPYLRHVGGLGKLLLLSTGMATLGEVEEALGALERAGALHADITLLHCTTEYPAPMAEVNLAAMRTLREAFGVSVGYSDHTEGIEVAIAAVALGATVIEKHVTLDRSLPGPDHKASLEPAELKAMVAAIRNVELAMGDGVKRATASEWKNREVARKSIVASRPIRAGEAFSGDNLTVRRPGTGVSPMRWDEVIGRSAPRDFVADEAIGL